MGNTSFIRHRRPRYAEFSRKLVKETQLSAENLVYPIFVQEEEGNTALSMLPGISRYGGKALINHVKEAYARGIPLVSLFPVVNQALKTETCNEAFSSDNLICRTIKDLKNAIPELGLMADVALDPYNPNGQDGFVDTDGTVANDPTVEALVKQSKVLADAGADVLGPSDMMDGRIGLIRGMLEREGHHRTILLSYAAKYASALYGPFRNAVGSSNSLVGDKKSYQMDPANRMEAIREIRTDLEEGADWVMIKPGHTYLDIITECKRTFGVPTFAYHVSGEYAMWAFAAQHGVIDRKKSLMEILLSFRRAGCDGILSYAAFEAADIL